MATSAGSTGANRGNESGVLSAGSGGSAQATTGINNQNKHGKSNRINVLQVAPIYTEKWGQVSNFPPSASGTILGASIRPVSDNLAFDGESDGIAGGNYVLVDDDADNFFALYGDTNGDRLVGVAEFGEFRNSSGMPEWRGL